MANGQIEQKSIVSNQQPALEQNPEKDILQGLQTQQTQPVQQPVQQQEPVQEPVQQMAQQTQQPTNLYQALGAMNPMQLMELKSRVQKRGATRQVYRNVGGNRGAEIMSTVNKGEMSIADAISMSKSELSPTMKTLDAVFFKEGATSASMLPLYEKMKNSWKKTERNLWISHYNTLKNRETQEENAKIQSNRNISAQDKARFQNNANNQEFKSRAQIEYLDLETSIANVGNFKGGVSKNFNTALDNFRTEYLKDLNQNLSEQGDQLKMNQYVNQIAKEAPIDYLKNEKGYMIGDEWMPIPEKGISDEERRQLFANDLIRKIKSAKTQMTNVREFYETPEPEQNSAPSSKVDFSQYMVEE